MYAKLNAVRYIVSAREAQYRRCVQGSGGGRRRRSARARGKSRGSGGGEGEVVRRVLPLARHLVRVRVRVRVGGWRLGWAEHCR